MVATRRGDPPRRPPTGSGQQRNEQNRGSQGQQGVANPEVPQVWLELQRNLALINENLMRLIQGQQQGVQVAPVVLVQDAQQQPEEDTRNTSEYVPSGSLEDTNDETIEEEDEDRRNPRGRRLRFEIG